MRFTLYPLVLILGAGNASAFVAGASGGKPGDATAEVKVGLERGLIEPNENQQSWQDARWNLFSVGLSYSVGNIGPLLDTFFRVGGTYYVSPAENNERGDVAEAMCRGQVTGPGGCQFYPRDTGGLLSFAVGFNAIHTKDAVLGFTLESNLPLGVEFDKFANPRVDYIAGSVQLGLQLNSWLSYQTNLYVGSGPFGPQNAQVAFTQLFGGRYDGRGWSFGLNAGPYIDGDLTERTDDRYDAAYTAGFPEVRDRVRMARFGVVTNPYVVIQDRFTIKMTYLQKFFGYDAAATQFFEFAVSARF